MMLNKIMPLFSIITINLNNAHGLKKTIESIFTQTFTDFEYIIIDGASTDESVTVIKGLEQKISYWISEKDAGIYNAMNKGISKATGMYCLFINSGDVLADKDVLKKVADAKPSEEIVYGDIIFAKNNSQQLSKQPDVPQIIYMIRGTIFHPASFVQLSVLKKTGGYDESFKIAGDYDFFVKTIIRDKVKTRHLSIVISVFDTTGISNNAINKNPEFEERARIHQRYFTHQQLNDAAIYSKLINSFSYRFVNFIERKTGIKALTKNLFKINYY
ncbi:MAG: glycosyltransferase family 2 protein [Bacteroidia bacterium]